MKARIACVASLRRILDDQTLQAGSWEALVEPLSTVEELVRSLRLSLTQARAANQFFSVHPVWKTCCEQLLSSQKQLQTLSEQLTSRAENLRLQQTQLVEEEALLEEEERQLHACLRSKRMEELRTAEQQVALGVPRSVAPDPPLNPETLRMPEELPALGLCQLVHDQLVNQATGPLEMPDAISFERTRKYKAAVRLPSQAYAHETIDPASTFMPIFTDIELPRLGRIDLSNSDYECSKGNPVPQSLIAFGAEATARFNVPIEKVSVLCNLAHVAFLGKEMAVRLSKTTVVRSAMIFRKLALQVVAAAMSSTDILALHHDGTSKNWRSVMEYHLHCTLPGNRSCSLLFQFSDAFDHSGQGLVNLFMERWRYLNTLQELNHLPISQPYHVRAVTVDTESANLGAHNGFCTLFERIRVSEFDLQAGLDVNKTEARAAYRFTPLLYFACADHLTDLPGKTVLLQIDAHFTFANGAARRADDDDSMSLDRALRHVNKGLRSKWKPISVFSLKE